MEIKTKKSLCAFLHLYMRKMFLLVFLMLSIGSLSAHPIQAKFLACDRFASGMRVTYLLTNTGNTHLYVGCLAASAELKGKDKPIYSCWQKLGLSQNLGGEFEMPEVVLLPQVPVKCIAYFQNISSDISHIDNIVLFTKVNESKDEGLTYDTPSFGVKVNLSFGGVDIKNLPSSNLEGSYFNNPDFKLNFLGCKRVGNGKVQLSYTLTNLTDREIVLTLETMIEDVSKHLAAAQDDTGKQYFCEYFGDKVMSLFVDGKDFYYSTTGHDVAMQPNVPRKFAVTIDNVPSTSKKIVVFALLARNKELMVNGTAKLVSTKVVLKNMDIKLK